jgi:rhodanese-related sulfurtransferase
MNTRLLNLPIIVMVVFLGFPLQANEQLAEGYAQLFAPMKGAVVGKEFHIIKPPAFVSRVNQGTPLVVLDVRTPAEINIFRMGLADTLEIPVDTLFSNENLQRLPKDRQIVVVCQTGAVSAAVVTALRHLGYDNAFILKGGLIELAEYLGPKEANSNQAKPKHPETPLNLKGIETVNAAYVEGAMSRNALLLDGRISKEQFRQHLESQQLPPDKLQENLKGFVVLPQASSCYMQAESYVDTASVAKARELLEQCNISTKQYPADQEIITYCTSKNCWLSVNAAKALDAMGFSNVKWFRGGVKEWMSYQSGK